MCQSGGVRFTERGGWWVAGQAVLFAAILGAAWTLGPDEVGNGWATAGTALFVAGAVLAAAGALPLGLRLSPFPEPVAGARLRTGGIFGLVRHPIYGGVILLFVGIAVRSGSRAAMVLAAALVPFFWLKSEHEELLLERRFDDYPAYRRRVRHRFLPWIV